MAIFKVEVAVALSRPPKNDATIFITVDAPNGHDAELVACQIASTHPRVVMPVASLVTDWDDE